MFFILFFRFPEDYLGNSGPHHLQGHHQDQREWRRGRKWTRTWTCLIPSPWRRPRQSSSSSLCPQYHPARYSDDGRTSLPLSFISSCSFFQFFIPNLVFWKIWSFLWFSNLMFVKTLKKRSLKFWAFWKNSIVDLDFRDQLWKISFLVKKNDQIVRSWFFDQKRTKLFFTIWNYPNNTKKNL